LICVATCSVGFRLAASFLLSDHSRKNHEVIPYHHPIKTGTLAGILKRIAAHHGLTVEELLQKLDL
jgi:hypothetical protein